MASLVLDTSAFSALAEDMADIVAIVDRTSYEVILLPLAADAELRYGYKNGTKEAQNLIRYQAVMQALDITLALPNQQTSELYAELATWTKRHGVATSNNDLWIAATAVQHGAQLLTLDKDFGRIPQVRLVPIPSVCD